MHNLGKYLFPAVLLAMAIGGGTLLRGAAPDHIIFSHRVHLESGSACPDCHADQLDDYRLTRSLPKKQQCAACHDVKADCQTCHTDPANPEQWKPEQRKTNFTHAVHRNSVEDCAFCHGTDLDAKPHQAGDHTRCGKCHAADIKAMLCAKCHRDLSFAVACDLAKFRHEVDFVDKHKIYTGRSLRVCGQCHRESYCNDCHSKKAGIKPSLKYPAQVSRSFIHRGDWVTVHRLEAKTDNSSCLKCHVRGECADCHERRRVSAVGDPLVGRHPAGWMAKGSPAFHGERARRDAMACSTCHHSAGPGYCVDCHKASLGLNPHPKGWEEKVNGLSTNDRMCAICHDK